MNSSDILPLCDFIQTATGLKVDNHRCNNVARAVNHLLATEGVSDVQGLIAALTARPLTDLLWRDLVNAITVGETYFFRNQAHFNALRSHLLPGLIAKRRESGILQMRLWSAGCATGEEPYSLVMLLHDLLPDIDDWQITILATDINTAYLERAKRGIYRASSFRNETPENIKPRWFKEVPGGFEIHKSLRNRVFFAPLNLVNDDFPSYDTNTMGMDLIMCRNVTIYFDEQTTRQITRRFYSALNNEGWLIVGHSEPMASIYQNEGFAPRNFENTVVYQKDRERYTPYPIPPVWTPMPAASPPVVTPSPPPPPPRHQPVRKTSPLPSLREPELVMVNESPVGPTAWDRAKTAADRGDFDEAQEWLLKASQENGFQPQVHYLRALVQLQLQDDEDALQSLRQAIYCDPDFALAHYSLGDLYAKRRDYKLARRHWQLALHAMADLDPETTLFFPDDLTVNMLCGLLTHRLDQLPGHVQEKSDVHL